MTPNYVVDGYTNYPNRKTVELTCVHNPHILLSRIMQRVWRGRWRLTSCKCEKVYSDVNGAFLHWSVFLVWVPDDGYLDMLLPDPQHPNYASIVHRVKWYDGFGLVNYVRYFLWRLLDARKVKDDRKGKTRLPETPQPDVRARPGSHDVRGPDELR